MHPDFLDRASCCLYWVSLSPSEKWGEKKSAFLPLMGGGMEEKQSNAHTA